MPTIHIEFEWQSKKSKVGVLDDDEEELDSYFLSSIESLLDDYGIESSEISFEE